MLSLFLQQHIPGLNVDATGQIIGAAEKAAKIAAKKAAKAAAAAAAKAAAQAAAAAEAQAAAELAAEELARQAAENATLAAANQPPSALVTFISELDPVMTAAVLGIIILVAFYIYRTRFSATGQRGDTYLLLGPMSGGKSALYFRLKQGLFRPTHTSMKENEDAFVPHALQGKVAPARFVDLPGHASQRGRLDIYKPQAKAVIFVLDGTAGDTLGKASQLLYTLLVDPVLQARRTPFFVAINKRELMDAGSSNSSGADASTQGESGSDSEGEGEGSSGGVAAFSRRLENLLDKTRSLQSTMQDIGGDGEARAGTLGKDGKAFKFSDSVCPITVGGVSAAKGDIDELLRFIQAH